MTVVDEAAAAAALAAASTPGLPLQNIRVLNSDGTLSEPPPGLLAGLGGITQQQEAVPAAAVLQQHQQQQEQLPQQYRVINAMTGEEVGRINSKYTETGCNIAAVKKIPDIRWCFLFPRTK